jgi:amino acid adenylation domain-containing protein
MSRFVSHLENLLEGMAAAPRRPVGSLPLMDEAELHQVLRDWNDTREPRWTEAAEVPVHELIAAQAGLRPDHPAVVQARDGAVLTYGALDRRADRLARHLQALGVGPGSCVGLLLERRPEMLVGLFGILKAGGAYVPLDPASPRERIDFTLRDAAAGVLVTGEPFSRTLTFPGVRTVCLDRALIESRSGDPVPCRSAAGDPAYVIYTSGTTGRPKGVVIPHRSLSGYAQAAAKEMRLGPADRVLQFASLSFDASVEEIFACLLRGGTLALRTEAMLASAAGFLETCRSWEITVLDLPTAWWHLLTSEIARAGLPLPESLRHLIIGGEAARPDRWAEWAEHAGDAVELVNTYGPTEATVVASRSRLTLPGMRVPIGRPLPNVRLYVLDRLQQPVPPSRPDTSARPP